MPIKNELIENGHVLLSVYETPWGLEDLVGFNALAAKHYAQATHKIHLLIDARQMGTIPYGVLRSRAYSHFTHPRSGAIAVVGASTIARALAETVLRLAHFDRAKFFMTQEEALEYLRTVIAREQ